MKNRIYFLAAALFLMCSFGTFTSCKDETPTPDESLNPGSSDKDDDDDEEEPTNPDKPFDYSGFYSEKSETNKLVMTYGGEPISGKVVEVAFKAPSSEEQKAIATLKLKGTDLDINSLLGELTTIDPLKTPGPIPGEPEFTLSDIQLTKETDGYSFDSEDFNSALGRTVKYSGKFTEGNLNMNLNVSYSADNDLMTNLWSPLQLSNNDDVTLRVYWDSDEEFEGLSGIVGWLLTFEKLPYMLINDAGLINGMGVNEVLKNTVQYISFTNDGCIIPHCSTSGDLNNPVWGEDANRNLMHYYMDAENNRRTYLEIDANYLLGSLSGLFMAASRAADPSDLSGNIKNLIEILRPHLYNGIPFNFGDNGASWIYVEPSLVLEIVHAVAPILENPMVQELLKGLLKEKISGIGFEVGDEDINKIVEQLPGCLAACTSANLDFCFKKYN